MSEVWEFPWEKEARRGAPVPDGLSQADQMAYAALRYVYLEFYAGRIEADQAGSEKRKLRSAWEQAKEAEGFDRKLTDYRVRLIRAVERAASECRKDPAPENALRLCDVIDGIERPELREYEEMRHG